MGAPPCRVRVFFTQAERTSLANWEVSVQGVLSFPIVAKQKSRSCDFCGGVGGLDVSAAVDVDVTVRLSAGGRGNCELWPS